MSSPIIQVRNLSKTYRLGIIGRKTLQEELHYLWIRARGRDPHLHMGQVGRSHPGATSTGMFRALDNVSFDIERGDVVGIVGHNGAGKSTLLKILSRITEPTAGEAIIEGRWGSLLEVGTGFHPELTGRENVYMNGTILGMKKAEIDGKFDEIVAFAGVEPFLDTPVKRYSSGMMVRLAFAVAAHLETEILIIDEVLAVGDAQFQKKCMRKMGEAAQSGRTILFVSHNLQAVRALCPRCILLDKGRATGPMPTQEALHHYAGTEDTGLTAFWRPPRPKAFAAVFLAQDGRAVTSVRLSRPFTIGLELVPALVHQPTHVSIQISNDNGDVIHHSADLFDRDHYNEWRRGHRQVLLPAHALMPGRYRLSFWIWHPEQATIEYVTNGLCWDVVADEPALTTYPLPLWKGVTGPALLTWDCTPTIEIPDGSNETKG